MQDEPPITLIMSEQITHCCFFMLLSLNPILVVKWHSEKHLIGCLYLKDQKRWTTTKLKICVTVQWWLSESRGSPPEADFSLEVSICSPFSMRSCKPAIKCCERQAVLSNRENNTEGASPQVGRDFELWAQPFRLSRISEFPHTKISNQAFFFKWPKASKAQSWRSLMPKQSFPSHPQLRMQKMIN